MGKEYLEVMGQGHYLIAVNTIDKPLTATFSIPFPVYGAVDVLFAKGRYQ